MSMLKCEMFARAYLMAFWITSGAAKIVAALAHTTQGWHVLIGILELCLGVSVLIPLSKVLWMSARVTAGVSSGLLGWNLLFPIAGSSCGCFGAIEVSYRLKLVLLGFACSFSWLVLFLDSSTIRPACRES